jgi:general secretion pathway protein C
MSLSRIVVWAVNGALAALCCWMVAGIASDAVASAMSAPTAAELTSAPAPPEPDRSWQSRQAILDRNLFKSATQTEAVVEDPDEAYAATKLPLKLLGTAAGGGPRSSWAAVEDEEKRQHLVVRVGDRIQNKADVVKIERRRIVLRNAGRMEQLALDEDEGPNASVTSARGRTYTRPTRAAAMRPAGANPPAADGDSPVERIQKLGENRFGVSRDDVQSVASNPAALFSQARILPKYQDGQMTGIQLNAIQAGSVFEKLGIQNGDTITGVNGVQINNQQDSTKVMDDLMNAPVITVDVVDQNGQPKTMTIEKNP